MLEVNHGVEHFGPSGHDENHSFEVSGDLKVGQASNKIDQECVPDLFGGVKVFQDSSKRILSDYF